MVNLGEFSHYTGSSIIAQTFVRPIVSFGIRFLVLNEDILREIEREDVQRKAYHVVINRAGTSGFERSQFR